MSTDTKEFEIPMPKGLKQELTEKWRGEWGATDTEDEGPLGNAYVRALLGIAARVMDYIDTGEEIDADALIAKADCESGEGITGNMAGWAAFAVSKYHQRGEEFRKSWNTHYGKPEAKGVVNPAIVTIG